MTTTQLQAAQSRVLDSQGTRMLHVWELAVACAAVGFPFFLGLAVMQKESNGRNIYGHDPGGAMYVPRPQNIEVTEENYREFRRLINSGTPSNGVGPLQLTYKPYFDQMESRGLRPWVAGDSIRFGVGILAASFRSQQGRHPTLRAAWWETARAWNGGTNPQRGRAFADDAVVKALEWQAVVGNVDAPRVRIEEK